MYHKKPFLFVAKAAARCIEGGKGGSYPGSLEAWSWDTAAQCRSKEAASSATASCLPQSLSASPSLTLLPQCAPANQAGNVSDWMSYYKILVRTKRETEGLKFDNC